MRKFFLSVFALLILASSPLSQAKTLVLFYSFTGNSKAIASDLQTLTGGDIAEISPAGKGPDYAANNYAIGKNLMLAIRDAPDKESSYPAVDPLNGSLKDYDSFIVVTPFWWGEMAAVTQGFLFRHSAEFSDKKAAMVVSSHSTGIEGAERDFARLLKDARIVKPGLWIKSSQTGECHEMNQKWLSEIGFKNYP